MFSSIGGDDFNIVKEPVPGVKVDLSEDAQSTTTLVRRRILARGETNGGAKVKGVGETFRDAFKLGSKAVNVLTEGDLRPVSNATYRRVGDRT